MEGDAAFSQQAAKNTRMQLREEFFNYEALRRTHDGLIVQWAHEEGLFVSAERWSQMLYQDRAHKAYLQALVDQKSVPLSKLVDTLCQHCRSQATLAKCVSCLQQFVAIPLVATGNRDQDGAARVTVADVLVALTCVHSLLSAYTAALRSPSTVAPRLASCETKGRFLVGSASTSTSANGGHTPSGSVGSVQDDSDLQSPATSFARPHSR